MQELLDMLYREGRIKLVQGILFYRSKRSMQTLIHERCGRSRNIYCLHSMVAGNYPIVLTLLLLLLFEEEDFISEFSLLGDAYSMQIRKVL